MDFYDDIDVLYEKGIAGLLEMAKSAHGFVPNGVFVNKCHLCLDIRRYLVMTVGLDSPELAPRSFYHEVWRLLSDEKAKVRDYP